MPGTLVQDALAPELYDDTIASATTTTGTGVEVGAPRLVAIEAVFGTGEGSHTLDIEIQGSDVSNFGSGVVSYGHFDTITSTSDNGTTRYLTAYVEKRYMRAVIVSAGTVTASPLVVTVREPHDRRKSGRTA